MNEPTTIRAGFTYDWDEESSDYPASGSWDLKYTFSSNKGTLEITCTKSGNTYTASITAAQSAALGAGYYTLCGYFTEGTAKHEHTIIKNFEVLPDLTAPVTSDQREYWQQVLDALKAQYLKRASIMQQGMSEPLTGKAIQYLDPKQLQDAIQHAENKLELAKNGGRRKKILMEFT